MKLKIRSIVALLLLFFLPTSVAFAEGDGGSITTTGKVSFFKGEASLSKTETPSIPQKVSEMFPHTGEIVSRAFFISGVIIVLFVFFFFLWKRRKKEEEDEVKEETEK